MDEPKFFCEASLGSNRRMLARSIVTSFEKSIFHLGRLDELQALNKTFFPESTMLEVLTGTGTGARWNFPIIVMLRNFLALGYSVKAFFAFDADRLRTDPMGYLHALFGRDAPSSISAKETTFIAEVFNHPGFEHMETYDPAVFRALRSDGWLLCPEYNVGRYLWKKPSSTAMNYALIYDEKKDGYRAHMEMGATEIDAKHSVGAKIPHDYLEEITKDHEGNKMTCFAIRKTG